MKGYEYQLKKNVSNQYPVLNKRLYSGGYMYVLYMTRTAHTGDRVLRQTTDGDDDKVDGDVDDHDDVDVDVDVDVHVDVDCIGWGWLGSYL